MSCFISNGYTLDCRNASLGGLKTIWILGDSGNTISSTTQDVDGKYTSISGTGTFYKFELSKASSSFEEAISVNTTAQSVAFTPTLTLSFPKLDQSLRNVFFELVKQNEIYAVVLDNNGRYWLVAPENGLSADSGSMVSGLGLTDLNGVNALVLAGGEPEPSAEIDDITTAFAGITFNA